MALQVPALVLLLLTCVQTGREEEKESAAKCAQTALLKNLNATYLKTVSGEQAQALLVAGIEHYSNEYFAKVSETDKALLRDTAIVSLLEDHGISLQQQFRTFAVNHAKESGLLDRVAAHGLLNRDPNVSGTLSDNSSKFSDTAATSGTKKKRIGKQNTQEDLRPEPPVHQSSFKIADELDAFKKTCQHPQNINDTMLKENIENYRKLKVTTQKSVATEVAEFAAAHAGDKDTVDALEDIKGSVSQITLETATKQKELIEKIEEDDHENWIEELQYDLLKIWEDGIQENELESLNHLRKHVKGMDYLNDKLADVQNLLGEFSEVDWEAVKSAQGGDDEVDASDILEEESGKGFKKFSSAMVNHDKKCAEVTTNRTLDKVKENKALSKKLQSLNEDTEDLEELNRTLDKELVKQEQEVESLNRSLYSAGQLTGKDIENIKKTKKADESIKDKACKQKGSRTMKFLKDMVEGARKLPDVNLGIRGAKVTFSRRGAGLEEVIDFDRKEIGVFHFGDGHPAKSLGAYNNLFRAGFGGFAGVGWKGYKKKWTLQETVKGVIVVSGAMGVPLLASFVPTGAGFSGALIVSPKLPITGLPWKPDLGAVKIAQIGWGLNFGSSAILNLNGFSVGFSGRKMYSSECYHSLRGFLFRMLVPSCKHCIGKFEKAIMGPMRLVIQLAGYKPVTDTLFSMLAIKAHMKMDKAERSKVQCSQGSTNENNDAKPLARRIVRKLKGSVQLLTDINKQFGDIEQALEKVGEEDLKESKEMKGFWSGLKDNAIGCFRAPRETSLTLMGSRLGVGIVRGQNEMNYLWTKHKSVLANMCWRRMPQTDCHDIMEEMLANFTRDGKSFSKKRLVQLVYDKRQEARNTVNKKTGKKQTDLEFHAVDEPFGFCLTDADCHRAALVHECGMKHCDIDTIEERANQWWPKENKYTDLKGEQRSDTERYKEIRSHRSCVCHDPSDTDGLCDRGHGRCMCNPGYCVAPQKGYDISKDEQGAGSGKGESRGLTFGELWCQKADATVTSMAELKEELNVWVQSREIELGSAVGHLRAEEQLVG